MSNDRWSFTQSGDDWMFKHIYDERRLGIFVFPGGAYRSRFSAGVTVRSIRRNEDGDFNSMSVFVDAIPNSDEPNSVNYGGNYIVIRLGDDMQTYYMTAEAASALRGYLLSVGTNGDANQLTEAQWKNNELTRSGSSVKTSRSRTRTRSRKMKRRLSKKTLRRSG